MGRHKRGSAQTSAPDGDDDDVISGPVPRPPEFGVALDGPPLPVARDLRKRLDPRTLTGAINADGSPAGPRRGEPSIMSFMPGQLVPGTRYRVIEWLGEGGMGIVYEAEHVDIERRVALKMLHSSHRGESDALRQFRDEAKAASKMGSEHVVEVFDFVELLDGRLMFAMELLRGTILSDELAAGPMPVARAIAIFRQVCKGLAAAHEAGIVHSDVKPENIALIERHGRPDFVKLLDFGIAAVIADRKTSGKRTGTPAYMAPDNLGPAANSDHRADIYSLGCTMYEALVGHPPFRGADVNEILDGHRHATPLGFAAAGRPGIPPKLEQLVLRCLAKDPMARFEDAHQLEAALCVAQIEAGIRTEWDDLQLPDVDRKYRARLRRDMPDPRGPVEIVSGAMATEDPDEIIGPPHKRGGGVAIGLATVVSLIIVGAAYYTMSTQPSDDSRDLALANTAVTAEDKTPSSPAQEPSADPAPVPEPEPEIVTDEEPAPKARPRKARPAPSRKGHSGGKRPNKDSNDAVRPKTTTDDEPARAAKPKETAADFIEQAAQAKRAGNRAQAKLLLEKALELDARNTIALSKLSDMAFDKGQYEQAARYASKAVEIAPNSARLRIKLGDAYLKLKDRDKARPQYERAAKLGSKHSERRLEKLDEPGG